MSKGTIRYFGIISVVILFFLGFLYLRRVVILKESETEHVSDTLAGDKYKTAPKESNSVAKLPNEIENIDQSPDSNNISDTVVGELIDLSIVPVIMDKEIESLQDFFPIHDSTIMQMISEINTTNDSLVSENMVKELNVVIVDNIMAYEHGDANEIFSSLTPAPFRVASFAQNWQGKAISEITKEETEKIKELFGADYKIPTDPAEIAEFVIEYRNGGKSGSRYKDVYDQLSVEGSQISFSETSSIPPTFREHFDILRYGGQIKFPNGLVTYLPTFEYINSPSKVLKQYGKIMLADVRLAASDSESNRYSRLKRFYWSEDDQTWLPMDFCFFLFKKKKEN